MRPDLVTYIITVAPSASPSSYGVRRWKRSAGTPPHFGTHGGWRIPLDIHSGCKYVVYGVRLWWKQGVPLPGCLIEGRFKTAGTPAGTPSSTPLEGGFQR